MSEFKGTKGKWVIPEHRDNIVNDEKGFHIATVWIAGIGNDNQMYNTKLIAAAPELLKALIQLKNWVVALDDWAGGTSLDPPVELAIEVIKKATE